MQPNDATAEVRRWQMHHLQMIWEGWCEDHKCPNNINYGLKPGATLRIKLPPKPWITLGSEKE